MLNETPLELLLVTSKRSDEDDLGCVLRKAGWRLVTAASAEEAIRILQDAKFPVVVWDRDADGMEWRAALHALAGASGRSVVILLSHVADQYLWEEVVRAGGFEVMTRPLRRRRTLATIEFAHRHWEAHRRTMSPA